MKKILIPLLLIVLPFVTQANSLANSITTEQTVWAFGDTHGAYDEFVKLLKQVDLVDEQLNWTGGKSHLVSTGDVLDRGPHPRKILDLMMKLEKQAIQAGGGFHFVLGNHEVFILTGDLRYVAPEEYQEFAGDETAELRQVFYQKHLKYLQLEDSPQIKAEFEAQHPAGFFARHEAFSPSGHYGKWLLQRPLMFKVNQNVFVHGGLSPELMGKSFEQHSTELSQQLQQYVSQWHQAIDASNLPVASTFRTRHQSFKNSTADAAAKFEKLLDNFLFSYQSPTWYRGGAYCHPFYENESLRQVLGQFNAKRLFVGHSVTPSRQVEKRLDDQVYLMDTGMLAKNYGGQGSIVRIQADKVEVFDTKDRQYQAIDGAIRPSFYTPELSEAEIAEILKQAPVELIEELKTGITRPFRLTFTDPRAKVRAMFKSIDDVTMLKPSRFKRQELEFSDRYQFEIAAYRLSEHMGFKMVPISVERKLKQRLDGVAQYWVENSYSQHTADEEGWQYQGYCSLDEQLNMQKAFDLLINNTDRAENTTNYLFERNYDQLIWIDHSRGFSIGNSLPGEVDRSNFKLTPEVEQALRQLDSDEIRAVMDGLLSRGQIRSMLKRRNRILTKYGRESD